jgi:hypothetical protein
MSLVGVGNCQYRTITTSGTTTVNVGTGVYYGYHVNSPGTTPTVYVMDGTNTLDGTATITSQALVTPTPAGIGLRFNTSLLIVQAGGSPANLNVLWDG